MPATAMLLMVGISAACKASYHCKLKGHCTVDRDRCVVASDADCRRSTLCKGDRKCEHRNGRCVK